MSSNQPLRRSVPPPKQSGRLERFLLALMVGVATFGFGYALGTWRVVPLIGYAAFGIWAWNRLTR